MVVSENVDREVVVQVEHPLAIDGLEVCAVSFVNEDGMGPEVEGVPAVSPGNEILSLPRQFGRLRKLTAERLDARFDTQRAHSYYSISLLPMCAPEAPGAEYPATCSW
jgi:hypothetical protein